MKYGLYQEKRWGIRWWFKRIIRECIQDEMKNDSMIISPRPPTSNDVYHKGCIWKHGNDIYQLENIYAKWLKKKKLNEKEK